jgi:hypothetical protein
MRPFVICITAFSVSIIFIFSTSCGNKTENKSTGNTDTATTDLVVNTGRVAINYTDTFVYEHREGAIPPGSGRNYEIRIIPGKICFSIRSNDLILTRDTIMIDSAHYAAFYTAIENLHVTSKRASGAACVSGDSEILTLHANSLEERMGFTYHCDGYNYSNLEGDVEAAAKLFKGMIPDLDTRNEATRKDK